MFKFDVESVNQALFEVKNAGHPLAYGNLEVFRATTFTTSPALGAVAAQYTSYIGDHPGSLAVATRAMLENVNFLHESMLRLTEAVEAQEAGAS
ncbi:MAG: hypothetical protein ACTH16_03850, partial [Corynebacterium variabile]